MRSTELDEHPRLTTLAGADRLVRLGVETYDWMRESALGRATTPPPATAVQQLRDAALLDPHSPDRPQLETHWLQLLRRALNRSEEHTSELQSRGHLVCRLLLEKKHTQARR